MAQFTKCWYCNKRINIGDKAFISKDEDDVFIFCSSDCFLKEYALEYELDIDTVGVSYNDFYDTETIKAQIRRTEAEIEHSQKELKRLRKELEE